MNEQHGTSLSLALSHVESLYELPSDDLVNDVLVPATACATTIAIGAGFFTSRSFAQIAPGLAAFLNTYGGTLRLLMSMSLSEEDAEAIELGYTDPESVLDKAQTTLFEHSSVSPSLIVRHATDCLAWMVAAERIEIRIGLYRKGAYHKKLWLFADDTNRVAVHGSSNPTQSGLAANGEQMSVDCSWWGEPRSLQRLDRLTQGYDRDWKGTSESILTVDARSLVDLLRERAYSLSDPPTPDAFAEAWNADYRSRLEALPPPRTTPGTPGDLSIPEDLVWETGRFRHQGEAVRAFEENGKRGILAIATGGGKTKTALIAASRDQGHQSLLVVIVVPTTPLLNQWISDLAEFGVERPFVPSRLDLRRRRSEAQVIMALLRSSSRRTECILTTTDLFRDDTALRWLIEHAPPSVRVFLIADEVHNLGARSVVTKLPERFDARLGLSATPTREYDEEGTTALLNYFHGQVYEFSVGDAIAAGCLVPYDYLLHVVELGEDEAETYFDLSDRIARMGGLDHEDGSSRRSEAAKRLLFQRRSLLEHAAAKLERLRELLVENGPAQVRRTLVYVSGKKDPLNRGRQIEHVNRLLRELGIGFHQFTYQETGSPDAMAVLNRFADGDLQVLTAMKVLDEGVNLPQTDTAFILASSATPREWVQRRGRLLRTAPGKNAAVLHDFLVVPPDLYEPRSKSILRAELRRAEAFAETARNAYLPGGPNEIIRKYEQFT